MALYKVISKVVVPSIGVITDEHTQEFRDDLNVFGRVLEYHKYMYSTFPSCKFELLKATQICKGGADDGK